MNPTMTIILVSAGLNIILGVTLFFIIKGLKRARAEKAAALAQVAELRRNIAHMAAAIEQDYNIQKSGAKIVQKIKEANTDEDAQYILDDLSSRIDGLL